MKQVKTKRKALKKKCDWRNSGMKKMRKRKKDRMKERKR